nr:cytokinin dehydrogenase 3-like [Tanacetum cinerariifolium]
MDSPCGYTNITHFATKYSTIVVHVATKYSTRTRDQFKGSKTGPPGLLKSLKECIPAYNNVIASLKICLKEEACELTGYDIHVAGDEEIPSAVFYPCTIFDLAHLIKSSYTSFSPFKIVARGRGHSIRGQAMAKDGVVVQMASLNSSIRVCWSEGLYNNPQFSSK